MNKKYWLIAILFVLLASLLVACAGTPEPPAEEVMPEKPAEEAVEESAEEEVMEEKAPVSDTW